MQQAMAHELAKRGSTAEAIEHYRAALKIDPKLPYRVVSSYQPFLYAIRITSSTNIRFRNVHCYSDSKVSFDNTVYDETHNIEIRQREFSWLTVSGNAPAANLLHPSHVLAKGANVEKLAGGFFNISGGAIDSAGDLYFVDARWQTIYCWSALTHQLSKVRDNPLDPVQLFLDKSGDLMVVSYAGNGTVYAFKPGARDDDVTLLPAVPAALRPGLTPVLPVDYWRNENDFLETIPVTQPYQFISPDGTTFLPVGADFVTGELYYGSKLNNTLRAFGFAPAVADQPYYVSDENGEKTYAATVEPDGTLSDLKVFTERGGESVTVDDKGNVYIAAGQIFIYDPSGHLIDTIDVPERPSQLLFGGRDGHVLFVLARSSLYAFQTINKGR